MDSCFVVGTGVVRVNRRFLEGLMNRSTKSVFRTKPVESVWSVTGLWCDCCKALLGQKYGYRPFPPTIDADEFSAIRAELAAAATDDDDDALLTLLDTWFKCNTNITPPVYTLQPISSVLPDYAHDSVTNSIRSD